MWVVFEWMMILFFEPPKIQINSKRKSSSTSKRIKLVFSVSRQKKKKKFSKFKSIMYKSSKCMCTTGSVVVVLIESLANLTPTLAPIAKNLYCYTNTQRATHIKVQSVNNRNVYKYLQCELIIYSVYSLNKQTKNLKIFFIIFFFFCW